MHTQQDRQQLLEAITHFADMAHGDQMRKYTPERYIVHPVRVMKICSGYSNDTAVLAAALLHDVLEDTPVSQEAVTTFLTGLLGEPLAKRTVQLVIELTDVYTKENYPKWNRRKRKEKELQRLAATSAEAQTIKYADIIDNASEIITADPDFARVFIHECRAIVNNMNKGIPALHKQALETMADLVTRLPSGSHSGKDV